MDEINRLRRDQLAVFVCSWNMIDPEIIQCEKFIVLKCIEKNRSAKLMTHRQTDIVTQEPSELRLICPIFMPVRHESFRVVVCLGDRNRRYDGRNRHGHDCCRRCSLPGRKRGQAYAPEARAETYALARVRPTPDICCYRFQPTPVACEMQISGGICKKCKSAHRSSYDENSWPATQPPNAERPTGRTCPVEILCVFGHEKDGRGVETSRPLQ